MPKDGTDSKKNHTSQHKQAKAQRKQKSSQIQDCHKAGQNKSDKSRRWKKSQTETLESFHLFSLESQTGSTNLRASEYGYLTMRICSANEVLKELPK